MFHPEALRASQRAKVKKHVLSKNTIISLACVSDGRPNKKRPYSHQSWTLHFLNKCGNDLKEIVVSSADYFFSSASGAAASFSYFSFSSQHFDLRKSLLRRPFFSTHLWASSSVLAFGQSALHVAIKPAVSAFAKTCPRLKLSAIPTITSMNLIDTPFENVFEFDNISLLHHCASMYQIKIDPTDIFQALSDKTRLRIMRAMVSLPREEICLCEATDALDEPEPNVSRHLKSLRQSGLLAAQKEGRWVYHRLVPSGPTQLFYKIIKDLPDTEGLFERDLARFKMDIKKRASARCQKSSATIASLKHQRAQYD